MNTLTLELDDENHKRLKKIFKGDEKAMSNFAAKVLADELTKISANKRKMDSTKNNTDLNDYLKSSKPGSRSYGTKGQGW